RAAGWPAPPPPERGLTVRATSDLSGGYYPEKGIDPEKAVQYRDANNGSLQGYPEATHITNEELLQLPVDLLVPAATEDVIHSSNAPSIQARLIVEGANGPTRSEERRVGKERNDRERTSII